jgi:hypothetical protein
MFFDQPSELEREYGIPPAPRKITPRAKVVSCGYLAKPEGLVFVVGVCFCVVGLVCTVGFCHDLWRDVVIDLTGEMGDGRVLSVRENYSVKINGQHPMLLQFEYMVDGQTYLGECNADGSGSNENDGAVLVQYAPGMPGVARIVGHRASTFGYLGLISLLFPTFGLAAACISIRSVRRDRRAFSEGSPILADVTFSGVDTSMSRNGRHQHRISWSFEVEGRSYGGSLRSWNSELLISLAVSGKVVVLYLPQDPSVNTLWVDGVARKGEGVGVFQRTQG